MRSSLRLSFALAVGGALFVGTATAVYNLAKFYEYENKVVRVMSGDQRSVIMGRLIQARLKATQELVQSSVENEEANESFRKRLQSISDELKMLYKEDSDATLDEVRASLAAIIEAKTEQVDDLFVHYRNLKATSFNFYRQAWSNKWMGVAKQLGLVISDLDNLPYQSADKASVSVNSKIQQTVGVITHSTLGQETKIALFSQLNTLKSLAAKYNEALLRSEALKGKRLEALKALETKLQKYNDIQGKGLVQFGNDSNSEVLKTVIATLFFILFGFGWHVWSSRRFGKRVLGVSQTISRQMTGWIATGGGVVAQGFNTPERAEQEFVETYRVLDQTMRRVNTLRKEDILVKRLLNVPFLLISRQKQAMFWNSALSILAKVRALEETGPMPYRNLLRFTDGQGRVMDPVEKAFTENKETTALALLHIGNDGIAVYVACTPVMGADNQPDYVMVHLRDLREENRRFEGELDRQLESVKLAIQEIRAGRLPQPTKTAVRKPVAECLGVLTSFALELQEKASVLAGQIDTMALRMEREAGLKKNVHGRMEQLKTELLEVKASLQRVKSQSEVVASRLTQIDARGRQIKSDYIDIKKKGSALLGDLKSSKELISQSLLYISESESATQRVRSNERVIHGILEKSAMLNANNSILSSKRELTPSEVASVTENITQLLGQFERSYRFIEESVGDIERSSTEIATRLRASLNGALTLFKDEQAILKSIAESERVIDGGSREASDFAKDISALSETTARLNAQVMAVESKIARLVQIGKASIDLQEQLEIGFRGITETQPQLVKRTELA